MLWITPSLTALGADPPAHKQDPPMVISVSWSSPDTRYLRLHANQWEQQPFTGTILTASWPQPDAGSVNMSSEEGSLSWSVFQGERFTPPMLDGATEDLRQTTFRRSRDNLLWVVSYLGQAGHFDWFDDARWATVLHNVESLAKVAHRGGLRGLLLDAEEYGCPFWSYGGTRPEFALKNLETYKGKSWEQTRDQVRQRGRSFIKAVNKSYPGCLVWLTYGYSHIVHQLPADAPADLSDKGNGLFGAFLDGMLEASDEKTIFVDGCEGAYRFSEPQEFVQLRKVVTDKALKYTLVPEIYRKKMRVGFGLYIDMYNYKDSHPWYSDRPNDNYMTPDLLQKALKNALAISDGYVWIYSEYPSWWLDRSGASFGESVRGRADHKWIPPAYRQAIEKAVSLDRNDEMRKLAPEQQ